jgi:hypothetical protein
MAVMKVFLSHWWRPVFVAGVFIITEAAPHRVLAQGNPDPFGFKFNSGQSIQPIFEGWAQNPDGTFSMYFGYLNRNYVETPVVPVGPDNKFEPGEPDRGQPTFFDTRVHRKEFSVRVPGDWGKKELVWTVTVAGVTEKAVAWLQPEWEIDPIYAGKTRNAESLKNRPPSMTLDVPAAITLPNTLTLAATVEDDGLPTPRKGPPTRAIGQETPPTLKPRADQPEMPINVPAVGRGRGDAAQGAQGPQGLRVNWLLWRGPAAVTFDAATVQVKDGKAVGTAKFTKPGTYVMRARANDGELTDQKEFTVTVSGPSQ